MNRLWGILVAVFLTSSALAQSVQQSGNVTPGHLPLWITSGVQGDGGTSADSPITSIGATGPICSNSARQSTGAYIQVCLQAFTNAPGQISIQNYGTASAQGLNFNINGTVIGIPTGGGTFIFGNGPFTVGDVPCFQTTAGVVQDCGMALAAGGIVKIGSWQGTPIAIAYGGTGATTQAGAQTALGLGTMALQNASNVAITGGTITGLPTPVNPSDAAIKSYVDASAAGLIILPASALATAAVLPNTPTYANGSSGVGATLTAGTNSTLTVDGTVAALNTVVLVKSQASAFQNGIYTVTTAGSGSAAWVLTRATYFNTAGTMLAGSYTFISGGSTNTGTSWALETTVTTVGTTAATFNQFSQAGGSVSSIATGSCLSGGPVTTTGTINANPACTRSYLAGLTLSTAGSSTTFGIAVGVANDSTNASLMQLLSAYTKTTAAWTVGSGNGALDTGSLTANSWYYVFLMQRTDTNVVDVCFSLSAVACTTGGSIPSAYSLFRRIGAMKTNGSSQWTQFTQVGDTFIWLAPALDVSTTTLFTLDQPFLNNIPTSLTVTALLRGFTSNAAVGTSVLIDSIYEVTSIVVSGALNTSAQITSPSAGAAFGQLQVVAVNGQINCIASNANTTLELFSVGWIDTRGKLI